MLSWFDVALGAAQFIKLRFRVFCAEFRLVAWRVAGSWKYMLHIFVTIINVRQRHKYSNTDK
jgi:hypothetical protein